MISTLSETPTYLPTYLATSSWLTVNIVDGVAGEV